MLRNGVDGLMAPKIMPVQSGYERVEGQAANAVFGTKRVFASQERSTDRRSDE